MGFLKRFFGLETKPGELQPLTDDRFDAEVLASDTASFVYFFNLWCSSCQVMSGLLNEIGPDYIGKARFFKLDAGKNPHAPGRYTVTSVPTVIAFKNGEPGERLVGLTPLDDLKEWIDRHL